MASELVLALRLVWRILSLGTVLVLLTPFLLSQSTLGSVLPACEAKLAGGACALCGMTTAFYRLSSGDISGALEANPLSLALYLALVVNLTVFVAVAFSKRKDAHAAR